MKKRMATFRLDAKYIEVIDAHAAALAKKSGKRVTRSAALRDLLHNLKNVPDDLLRLVGALE